MLLAARGGYAYYQTFAEKYEPYKIDVDYQKKDYQLGTGYTYVQQPQLQPQPQ